MAQGLSKGVVRSQFSTGSRGRNLAAEGQTRGKKDRLGRLDGKKLTLFMH